MELVLKTYRETRLKAYIKIITIILALTNLIFQNKNNTISSINNPKEFL